MVENRLRDFRPAYGIRSVCLRCFNAAGADPDGEIGENHHPESHVIPLVIEAAFGRRCFLRSSGQIVRPKAAWLFATMSTCLT